MRNLIAFIIAITITVIFVNLVSSSTQVREEALKSEVIISNAIESFLDKSADSGAITDKDYIVLMTQLNSTGGAFDVAITVSRLMPVPLGDGGYSYEYLPAYGWHSSSGGVTKNNTKSVPGTEYLTASDNIALVVKQVDAMPYQRTMVTRLGLGSSLGTWTYSKSVRNTGSSMVSE